MEGLMQVISNVIYSDDICFLNRKAKFFLNNSHSFFLTYASIEARQKNGAFLKPIYKR